MSEKKSNTSLFGFELSKAKRDAAKGGKPVTAAIREPKKMGKNNKPSDESEGLNKYFQPGIPGINILPPEVYVRYEAVALRKKFLIVAGALVALFVVGFFAKFFISFGYQGTLDDLEQEAAGYHAQIGELRPYQAYADAVESKRSTLAEKVGGDLDNSAIMTFLSSAAAESGVTLESVALTPTVAVGGEDAKRSNGAATNACPTPDPFNPNSGIACISFSGTAKSVADANAFSDALRTDGAFLNTYVQNVLETEDGFSVQGSVAVSPDLYSDRFTELNIPVTDLVALADEAAEEGAN